MALGVSMNTNNYPIDSFIHYLTTYGPGGTSNVSLYDEHVLKVARRSGIPPIQLSSDDLQRFTEILTSKEPCNILITGVAGDGKTYLCRQAWKSLGGTEENWNKSNIVGLDIQVEETFNRHILVVKDLTDGHYEDILNSLYDSLDDPYSTIIIACNHGQILKKLQDSNRPELNKLGQIIERRFFDTSVELPKGLELFDLKQSRQDNMFRRIVKSICSRQEWNGCCNCPKCNVCPILKNRDTLYNQDGTFTQTTERMAILFRLLELEGLHFPIREQLCFVANALLGKSHIVNMPDDLAECEQVRNSSSHLSERIDLYDNLFGRNLSRNKQLNIGIYATLRRFEIGNSSTRFLDSLLLDGVSPNISLKGDRPDLNFSQHFLSSRQDFLADQPTETVIEKFHDELKRARRRLFFTWDPQSILNPTEANRSEYSIWSLTALPHAQNYFESFIDDHEYSFEKKKTVDEKLFTGLFQVMTGSRVPAMASELLITTRGAEVSSKSGQLQVASYPHKRSFLYIKSESERSALPILHISSSRDDDNSITYKLTPHRYECLMQISEGYIASSFSRECLTELMGLKAKLIHDYRQMLEQDDFDDEDYVTITLFPGREIEIQLEY